MLFWPFPLFGNPGGDAGVAALHDAFLGALEEHAEEPASRLQSVAREVDVGMIEFLQVEDLAGWRAELRGRFEGMLEAGDFPVVVGANHLVALPLLDAYADKPERVAVLSFDAHLDAYDLAASREPIHHGNFLLHLAKGPRLAIANVGHRDLVLESAQVEAYFDRVWGIEDIAARPLGEVAAEIARFLEPFDRVHIDIDLDALDPSVMRAVGTPMPCGLSTQQLVGILGALWSDKVSGVSISEYDAGRDLDGNGRHLVVWLIEMILLRRAGVGYAGGRRRR